jgi:two-component system, cell cycle response regulator
VVAVAKTKILLVDDTKLILELEKSFLKFSRVEVMTAANGIEALELIRRDPPDLIFMDMNMPAMDGISCCTLLKADPFLCSIPVVMLTTAGREGDRERAMKAGCDDYITKPIDRREFLEKARKYTNTVDRRMRRIPCHFPAIFLLGKSPIGGHAMDISCGGLYLATREEMRRDRRDRPLKLVFYLPGVNPVLMELLGTVAWINEEGNRVKPALPAGFGVQFQDLEEKETAILQAFLDAEELSHSGNGQD